MASVVGFRVHIPTLVFVGVVCETLSSPFHLWPSGASQKTSCCTTLHRPPQHHFQTDLLAQLDTSRGGRRQLHLRRALFPVSALVSVDRVTISPTFRVLYGHPAELELAPPIFGGNSTVLTDVARRRFFATESVCSDSLAWYLLFRSSVLSTSMT